MRRVELRSIKVIKSRDDFIFAALNLMFQDNDNLSSESISRSVLNTLKETLLKIMRHANRNASQKLERNNENDSFYLKLNMQLTLQQYCDIRKLLIINN